MPRKRRSAHTRETDLKNIVRGAGGSPLSIEILKHNLSASEATSIAAWLRHTQRLSSYFKYLVPISPSGLGGLSLGPTQSFATELNWAIGILKSERKRLELYLEFRQKLDSLISSGEFEAAKKKLSEISAELGWSHHMLGTMCFLVGQTEGLEAQKSWIEQQVFSRTNMPVVFFAYWLGVRTEPDSEPGVFERSLKSYIDDTGDKEESTFLNHIFFGTAAPGETEAILVRQLQSQSLIDLYEGLVIQSIAASCDFRSSSELYYNKFLPFMRELGDDRATRISLAMGDGDALIELERESPEWSPSQELNFLRNLSSKPSSPAPILLSELMTSIGSSELKDREVRTKLGAFAYASLWGKLSQIAGTAYRLRSATTLAEVLEQYRFRFIHDDGLDPFFCGLLHPAVVTAHFVGSGIFSSRNDMLLFEFGRALANRELGKIKTLSSSIREIIGKEDAELLRIEIITYLEEGSYLSLIKRLYPLLSESDDIVPSLPYSKIAECMSDEVIRELGDSPEIATVLARIAPFTGERTRSQLLYSVEQFLNNLGCDRASQLDSEFVKKNKAVKDLILLGCEMDTLAHSLNFLDGDEMQQERINQLQLLAKVDASLAFRCNEEIEEIIRSQEIANAIDKLKNGKIDCDEAQIQAKARDNLSGKFDRFRSFVEAGILPTTPGLQEELLVAIREGTTSSPVFEVPANESTSIVQEIVNELIALYSFDPVFGLNSYLSLRVRHGTISGQLRRSWSEERLLTTADSNGEAYEPNNHWFDILANDKPIEQSALIAQALADFSSEFDELISNLTDDRIQILSKEKPEGIISTGLAEVLKLSFYDDVTEIEDFDDFLAAFSSLFWTNLETTLESTRKFLRSTFRNDLNSLFDKLEQTISDITNSPRTPPLTDAITRARLATNQSIDEMLEWFRGSRPVDTDPFPMDDLARIGMEIVKRLHPDFEPDLKVSAKTDFAAVSALFTFTDVFFVLFDNVQKHSGFRKPEIKVIVETIESEVLRVVVESDCDNVAKAVKDAAKANKMISSGEFTKGLAAEGGTGLAKLAKIVANSKSAKPLEVSVNETAQLFTVSMEFSFIELANNRTAKEPY